MPLSPPVNRRYMHTRAISIYGFARDDGRFDIEGHITDMKPVQYVTETDRVVNPGERLHEMWVRLVIDEAMTVHEIEAVTDASPHGHCPEATAFLQRLKGRNLLRGWRAAIKEQLPGVEGCAHLKELLNAMASGAFQSLTVVRKERARASGTDAKHAKMDSCYAYSVSGPLVQKKWPQFFVKRD